MEIFHIPKIERLGVNEKPSTWEGLKFDYFMFFISFNELLAELEYGKTFKTIS